MRAYSLCCTSSSAAAAVVAASPSRRSAAYARAARSCARHASSVGRTKPRGSCGGAGEHARDQSGPFDKTGARAAMPPQHQLPQKRLLMLKRAWPATLQPAHAAPSVPSHLHSPDHGLALLPRRRSCGRRLQGRAGARAEHRGGMLQNGICHRSHAGIAGVDAHVPAAHCKHYGGAEGTVDVLAFHCCVAAGVYHWMQKQPTMPCALPINQAPTCGGAPHQQRNRGTLHRQVQQWRLGRPQRCQILDMQQRHLLQVGWEGRWRKQR